MVRTGVQTTKVLVVDDENGYCRKLGRYLSARGYDVTTASSGEEAVTIGSRTRPALVVTDWMLRGDVHGIHVIDTLRAVYPDTRTIMMSGFASADLRDEAASRDVAAFVEKPFSPEQLDCAIEHALRLDVPVHSDSRIPLLSLNANGRVLRANDAAAELVGRPVEKGIPFSALFAIGGAPSLEAAGDRWVEAFLESGESELHCRIRARSFGADGWTVLICRNEDAAAFAYDPSVKLLLDDASEELVRWKLDGHGLVVDRDGSTRSLVSCVFEELGSLCHAADTLDRALELCARDPKVRYVVVDCATEGDVGAFVERLREVRPDCKVIGHCEQPFEDGFARAGIAHSIRKPWTVSDFMTLLSAEDE